MKEKQKEEKRSVCVLKNLNKIKHCAQTPKKMLKCEKPKKVNKAKKCF